MAASSAGLKRAVKASSRRTLAACARIFRPGSELQNAAMSSRFSAARSSADKTFSRSKRSGFRFERRNVVRVFQRDVLKKFVVRRAGVRRAQLRIADCGLRIFGGWARAVLLETEA